MRKLTVFWFLLLYSISGFAQKAINEKEFESLLDYVNCRYANKYIENVRKIPKDSIAYYNIIKPVLDNSTLKKHLSSKELIKLLTDNSWGMTAFKLVKARQDEKRFSEIQSQNNHAIIEYIVKIDEPFQKVIGNDFINQIKKELFAQYPDKQIVENLVSGNSNIALSVQELHNKLNLLIIEKNKSIQKLTIFMIIGFLCIAGGFGYLYKKNLRDKKSTIERDEPSNKISEELQKLKGDIKEIKTNIDNHKHTASTTAQNIETKSSSQSNNIVKTVEMKKKTQNEQYFNTKSRKVFYQECDSKDAAFKVFNIKNNNAEFEYCGGAVSPDFLTDVCEFINNPWRLSNINRIITRTAGKVSKNHAGNWEVAKPAEIEFL